MKNFQIVFDNSIEKLIMAQVFKKQIRLREMFKDYDPLRKGTVTEDKVSILHFNIKYNLFSSDPVWQFSGSTSRKAISKSS